MFWVAGSSCAEDLAYTTEAVYAEPSLGYFALVQATQISLAGEHAVKTAFPVLVERLAGDTGSLATKIEEALMLADRKVFYQAQKKGTLDLGRPCTILVAALEQETMWLGSLGQGQAFKIAPEGTATNLMALPAPDGLDANLSLFALFSSLETTGPMPDNQHGSIVRVCQVPFTSGEAVLLSSQDFVSDEHLQSMIACVTQQPGNRTRVMNALINSLNATKPLLPISLLFIEGRRFARAVRAYKRQGAKTS